MSSGPNPFWLCHECGAQMRPIKRDGVEHCASCDGEFLEILDDDINPDTYHDLPPPPPTRPGIPSRGDSSSSQGGFVPGFIPNLLQGLFGRGGESTQGQHGDEQPAQRSRVVSPTGQRGTTPGSGAPGGFPGGRTFEWNVGGGRGSITFGSFGGTNMGPFGPAGGDDNRGLEDFFPFGPPPNAHARRLGGDAPDRQPQTQGTPLPFDPNGRAPDDWIRALMAMLVEDGMGPGGGIPGRANLGDYAMTENGFDQILEQLMHAAGPQGPLPASDVVIEGLPRSTLTEESLEKSTFKDCPVCKDDFEVGNEVMRIPCAHIFHPDCIQPWLKVNGSCPVCRFSLVPDEANAPTATQSQADQQSNAENQIPPASSTSVSPPSGPQQSAPASRPRTLGRTDSGNPIASVLQRLWGQSGSATASSATTPTSEYPSHTTSSPATPSGGQSTWLPATATHSGLAETPRENMSSAIPDDYRDRHRRREQQQHQSQGDHEALHDDLD